MSRSTLGERSWRRSRTISNAARSSTRATAAVRIATGVSRACPAPEPSYAGRPHRRGPSRGCDGGSGVFRPGSHGGVHRRFPSRSATDDEDEHSTRHGAGDVQGFRPAPDWQRPANRSISIREIRACPVTSQPAPSGAAGTGHAAGTPELPFHQGDQPMRMKHILAAGVAVALLAASVPQTVIAQKLTITSWGGSYSMSQRKAYYEPFMKETGLTILEDEWDGSIAIIRAMVETGNYKSHVLDGSVAVAGRRLRRRAPRAHRLGCDGDVPRRLPARRLDRMRDCHHRLRHPVRIPHRRVSDRPAEVLGGFLERREVPRQTRPQSEQGAGQPRVRAHRPTACRPPTSTRCCAPRAASIAHSRRWTRSRIT